MRLFVQPGRASTLNGFNEIPPLLDMHRKPFSNQKVIFPPRQIWVMLAVILVLVVGTIRLVGSNANNAFFSVASSLQ
jgi:hypothetical protein